MTRREPEKLPSRQVDVADGTHEELRREVEELRRQLRHRDSAGHGAGPGAPTGNPWNPSSVTIWSLFLGVTVLLAIAFFAGYLPLQKRNSQLSGDAKELEQDIPRAQVIEVARSASNSELELPG